LDYLEFYTILHLNRKKAFYIKKQTGVIPLTLWIDVAVKRHRLTLFDGSHIIKRYPIAVGKMLTPTPTGNYTLINKDPHPGGPFGVMWMGLSQPHYGIHGTNNPASIGKNVSHGCIRMYNRDVLELSGRVPIGTNVYIHP
jgi:lipoprotein-anchoring transpeptidase ErfK/SrfK